MPYKKASGDSDAAFIIKRKENRRGGDSEFCLIFKLPAKSFYLAAFCVSPFIPLTERHEKKKEIKEKNTHLSGRRSREQTRDKG